MTSEPSTHRYMSTGCFHGDHAYCQAKHGAAGPKRPAECKFCGAPCVCPCHTDRIAIATRAMVGKGRSDG